MKDRRDIVIHNAEGKEIFRQNDVECPSLWSDTACQIACSKYFYGEMETSKREKSIFGMIDRVVDTIAKWGWETGYFKNQGEKEFFYKDLKEILIDQKAAFNSPIYFNLGTPGKNFSSACFILSVDDNIESIIDWWAQESVIFNGGSGSGVNVSSLRSRRERLSGGGKSSGPLSFARAADSLAGTIKSGGKNRRSAKMVILNDSHPDIIEFIDCKINSEKQLRVLHEAGFTNGIDNDHLGIPFQNSNHAVRLTDDFMNSVKDNLEWTTYFINSPGLPCENFKAKDILRKIAEAVHFCGDPGVMFHDTINNWNTVFNTHIIKASNPCVEYNFIDDSACNLASMNLVKFYDPILRTFNIEEFKRVVRILITAQDIVIDCSDFPTDKIKENSMKFRPLGLGYANLGSLLMKMGYPYDSDEGRNIAASIASLMTAQAYYTSGNLAISKGSFFEFKENEEHILRVFEQHRDAARLLEKDEFGIKDETCFMWDKAMADSYVGFRNAQVTLMAPTGTISLMMDCDTTGLEPAFSLVQYKKLAGGGHMTMANETFSECLDILGYGFKAHEIISHIRSGGNLENSGIEENHLPIFDCALPMVPGGRCLSPEAHLKMLASIQPHISGASSKTINLPNEIKVEEIEDLIIKAWEWGIKAVTFYRDGSKVYQPLTTKKEESKPIQKEVKPIRKKLPVDCVSKRHKFRIGEIEGYLHCGVYEDGSLGEVFITISKEGSTIAGLMDTIATLTSIALQYGVPLDTLVNKFSYVRFEPSGFTDNPNIKTAKSVVDYVFRYLGENFGNSGGILLPPDVADTVRKVFVDESFVGATLKPDGSVKIAYSAPLCNSCGGLMSRSGTCYTCTECGFSSGGCG